MWLFRLLQNCVQQAYFFAIFSVIFHESLVHRKVKMSCNSFIIYVKYVKVTTNYQNFNSHKCFYKDIALSQKVIVTFDVSLQLCGRTSKEIDFSVNCIFVDPTKVEFRHQTIKLINIRKKSEEGTKASGGTLCLFCSVKEEELLPNEVKLCYFRKLWLKLQLLPFMTLIVTPRCT